MKQKDILLISVVVIIAATVSFVVSSKVFAPPKDRKTLVEVVEPITTEFKEPNKQYFNDKSVNPTKTIEIGGAATQPEQPPQSQTETQ